MHAAPAPDLAVYDLQAIRQAEMAACASLPAGSLMRAAGQAAAALAPQLLCAPAGPVLVLAGPGNNGGDACETAHLLAAAGHVVTLLLCTGPERYSPEATDSLRRAQASRVRIATLEDWPQLQQNSWALVIDGLFGIGLSRAISGALADLIRQLNQLSQQQKIPALALDVPSGLNADSGQIVGDGGVAVRASHTISFIGDKPGLHTGAGRDLAGRVSVAGLDLPAQLLPPSGMTLNDPRLFAAALQPRLHDSHKGSYGDVLILGGAAGMSGAAILAGRSALYGGAGRVYLGCLGTPPAYDALHPELMCGKAADLPLHDGVLVIGPGMGQSRAAAHLLTRALRSVAAMVIDADALNLIAREPNLQQLLSQRSAATLLTPHPLEAARLLGVGSREVQHARLQVARQLAQKFNATIVLKGSGSVICRPDGQLSINPTGNPALASAGTGDVLAGLCGALLAQKMPVWDAANTATWVHGRAADQLVGQGIGPIGLCASELLPAIRTCLNRLIDGREDA